MPEAVFDAMPHPLEVRMAGNPIPVTPPKPSVDEYFRSYPDAERLDLLSFNVGDVLRYQEELTVPDLPSARLEIARMASSFTQYGTEYGELLDPDALGCVLSVGNELLAAQKLSWDALVQGVNRPEVMLGDYLHGMAITNAARVFGRSDDDGRPLFGFLSPQEREDVFPFLLRFNRYMPHFADSMTHIAGLLEQVPIHPEPVQEAVAGMCQRMEALLADAPGELRNQLVQNLMGEFADARAQQTQYLHAFIVSPVSRLSGLLDHSRFRDLHAGEMKTNWETIAPWSRMIFGDISDEDINTQLAEMRAFIRIAPELPNITRKYIEAAQADAQAIGAILDRRVGETDEGYLDRLRELTRIVWSEKQQNFMEFLKEGYDSGELQDNPELILARISQLCGVELKHAQVTPTQTALLGLAANFAMNSYAETGEAHVYQMQTNDQVMRKRVLITVPEINYGFEWRFTDANNKSAVPLDDSDFLEGNGPMNEMTEEQYDVFCDLMEVVSFLG